ncbi:hypothetical protein ACTD5D_40755 [Nocardia takedensis]|uniref:hypothetical protein n=1 Tax=Nocardia takedensis TaxID=259390 RepID=UPI003F775D26
MSLVEQDQGSSSVLSDAARHGIGLAAGLARKAPIERAGVSIDALLRPARNLQSLVWLAAQAVAGEMRARALLTAAADAIVRRGECGEQRRTCSAVSVGPSVTAEVLDIASLVATAWHITYLFADAPQRRERLLDLLVSEAVGTYPIALLSVAADSDTGSYPMMMATMSDIGFDIGGLPDPGDPGLDFDGFDPESVILDLLGSRHRLPRLVVTDVGPIIDIPGRDIDIDRDYPGLRCFKIADELLRRHAAPPPVQLTPATWITGITAVETTGPCAGDVLLIRGSGFGAVAPAGVLVLVPRLGGWAPVAVNPGDWSDTLIKVVLPADVVSGPVGFGDSGYLAVYNAWVDQMNAIADELARLPCAPEPGVPRLPYWLAPPVGTVNIVHAGEAHIVMFAANGGISTAPHLVENVLTPGTPLRLDWQVVNADTLRVERVGADGPPVWVTDTSQTHADLGAVAHRRPSRFYYRLTVQGPCGQPRQVTISVYASQRPQLRAAGSSVDQGWGPPEVRLVAGKTTLVRARVRHGLKNWDNPVVPSVSGTLMLANQWSGTTEFIAPAVSPQSGAPMRETPGTSITVPTYPDWASAGNTLNFLIPGPLTTREYSGAAVRVSVTGFGQVGSFPGYSQQLSIPVTMPTFHPRRPLEIRYVRIEWGATFAPTDEECVEAIERALSFLPTPWANIAPLYPGQTRYTDNRDGEDHPFEHLRDQYEEMHYGDALWVVMVPSNSGGNAAGQASKLENKTGFIAVSEPSPHVIAHEIAHCFKQKHIELCGAKDGESAAQWDGGNYTGVVIDWRSGHTLISPWDLMTYCQEGNPVRMWPVPRRWNQLFDRIGS